MPFNLRKKKKKEKIDNIDLQRWNSDYNISYNLDSGNKSKLVHSATSIDRIDEMKNEVNSEMDVRNSSNKEFNSKKFTINSEFNGRLPLRREGHVSSEPPTPANPVVTFQSALTSNGHLKEMSDSKSALTGFEQSRTILKKTTRPKHEKNDKYHKIFKRVPADENLIEHFSCAYFGDILLQGCLYISANWFCFYSKILGRVKLIEIPLESVIEITRRRTAFVIPNAIGIRTKQNKYVFGSLLSRDNTFKLMNNVWRMFSVNRPIIQPSQGIGEIEDEEDKDNAIETGDNENDSDESLSNSGRRTCHKNRTPSVIFKRQSCSTSEVKMGERKPVHASSFLTKIWLGVCFVLVIILSILAFYLTLKVFDLQAKIELETGYSYSTMKTDYVTNVHNLRDVLKSNVNALKAIGDSIQSMTEEQTEEPNS